MAPRSRAAAARPAANTGGHVRKSQSLSSDSTRRPCAAERVDERKRARSSPAAAASRPVPFALRASLPVATRARMGMGVITGTASTSKEARISFACKSRFTNDDEGIKLLRYSLPDTKAW
eukprot:CAMPEP_0119426212 /NCGR_PEP_ID=MMETSP1335-20130426/35943_1 /TAXON_ID=259385 /ORGANISM="Chrysoculter rhomboideus, Strain RCC1486" /LENGTH=119 /DNA_ID=CAMNT_0007451795 /DNA_START=25 /DNA_END=381 /DNA_ORIENTATION=-